MSERSTRQQIYDRIRAAFTKDSYILEEMKRLGFWDSNVDAPTLPERLIQREAEINQELNKLLAQDRKFRNQEAMLAEMRKARMKQAREKRVLTLEKNKQKRLDRAARWRSLQQEQIIYLGKGVSAGLNNTDTNVQSLQKYNLPVFSSLTELANSMNLDLAKLRYLIFQRQVSRHTHYHTFEIPKKSGGKRKISAPKRQMKALQRWILDTILSPISMDEHAHGFIKNRSILTNAQPHTGKEIVINVDLKDFFPSIDFKRVKGLFHKLGYSEQMAIIFALICTQAETETVEMDGVRYYVQRGKRILPQGSPASPAISNLVAYKLDKKVNGLAEKLGFTYTRYADDLSFSTFRRNEKNVARLLHFLGKIIESEGLVMHPDKTQVMRNGGLQKVTGIVVNEKLNVQREQLRKFRALLHNIEVNGWKDQRWGHAHNLIHSIEGYIQFVKMVNPRKGDKFRKQLDQIIKKHGCPPIDETTFYKKTVETSQPSQPITSQTIEPEKHATPKGNDWWNIFS
ncbi:MAG: retron St85 family RNA-directed DNA polymerase [Bacteroides sp.]|nr:retron St85 family RNA-directed DNA polymerase [Bacteroides sp.]